MALLASDIFSQAQAFLNDTGGVNYTTTKLLPYLIIAYDDLKLNLISVNAPPIEEVSAALSVAALATELASPPADMIIPLKLEERAVGDTLYTPMTERDFEPDRDKLDSLINWTWRELKIKFVGALQAREVRVYYLKSLADPTSGASTISVEDYYKTFLSSRTASLAAYYIGQNESRATALQENANNALGLCLGIVAKRRQSMPIRQRPWGWWRRRRSLIS
jgi:hypothetical protein